MTVDRARHEFTGMLTTQGVELILLPGDGRCWLLRPSAGIERHVGRMMRVAGVRRGNILHVDRVDPA